MSSDTLTPEVLWAQRSSKVDADKNFIYLTIGVPDVPKDKFDLKLTPSAVTFTGYSNTLKRKYHVELNLYAEINEAESQVNHTARDIELKLIKKDLDDAYWPRLLKEAKKVHFLKTDFDKWVDEDEQNEVADEDFSNFGGMGGMPGMGGMGGPGGGAGDFGGIDFSKLGGGMDGADLSSLAGAAGANLGEDDEDDDDDDDEMPALEGEEGAAKGKETTTEAKPAATETEKASETKA